jgi:RloB-like protein
MSRKDRSRSAPGHRRTVGHLPRRQSFLIFCEGPTEVGYFNSFNVRAKPLYGKTVLKMVEDAIAYKKKERRKSDQYWIVFDKDDNSDEDFDKAILLAQENDIQVAWSNQAFECWFILHYRDFNRSCHRGDYEKQLKKFILEYDSSKKGKQQGERLFNYTRPDIGAAIKNARKGYLSFKTGTPPSQRETCTKVFELVEEILKNSE